jgi:hypothetical protein
MGTKKRLMMSTRPSTEAAEVVDETLAEIEEALRAGESTSLVINDAGVMRRARALAARLGATVTAEGKIGSREFEASIGAPSTGDPVEMEFVRFDPAGSNGQDDAEAEEIAALEQEYGRLEDHEIAEVLCDSVDRGTGPNGHGVPIMAGFARRLKEQRERGEQTNHADFVARDGRTARVILGRQDGDMVAMEHGSAGHRRGPYVFVVLPSAADGTVSLMHLPADVEPIEVGCEQQEVVR